MKSLRSSIYAWNTQEPPVQSTGAVPDIQVPQEPSVQSKKENLLLDDAHVLIPPFEFKAYGTYDLRYEFCYTFLKL